MTEPRPDVTDLPDLASRRLGGSVIAASDELFAEKENLIKPEAPVFAAGAFGNRGKIYDGWETRRRREPGHDHAIVRLGVPGIVHGVVVDTSFFRGNYPPEVSVEAVGAEGYPSPDELAAMTWHTLVARTGARGDAVNIYPVADRRTRWTHARLSIYPDGGVARFRVHGTAMPDPRFLAGVIDLAAAEHGGRVTGCSDAFYSSAGNLIVPGRAAGMGEGWENARRRGPGHDYVVVALAAAGELRHVEIDTSWFVGNAPGWVRLLAADARKGEPEGRGAAWTEERATKERGTREGGASEAPRGRAGELSEPEGRGAAWTEERATKERGTREGGASEAPRGRAGELSEPEGRGAAWTEERATKERGTREGGASEAPRGRAGELSEPEGRGAAWTEERATKERGTREGGATEAPRGRAGEPSEPAGRGAPEASGERRLGKRARRSRGRAAGRGLPVAGGAAADAGAARYRAPVPDRRLARGHPRPAGRHSRRRLGPAPAQRRDRPRRAGRPPPALVGRPPG